MGRSGLVPLDEFSSMQLCRGFDREPDRLPVRPTYRAAAVRLQPRTPNEHLIHPQGDTGMAHSNTQLRDDLKPMSEVHGYRIEKGDPDPRGFTVMTDDGRAIGRVDDLIIDTAAMKVRYLVVDRSGSGLTGKDATGHILLPVESADVRSESQHVITDKLTGNEQAWTQHRASSAADRDAARMTRSEEELEVQKREGSRGEVRVRKHVETEHVSQPVTRKREEVVIERRPVEAGARADASISEGEIRVPLTEEEIVVEKRPVVKEELVVGKRVVEERDTVEADVRREEFDIENSDTAGRSRPKRRE
jgi:uncharacterized protein (TIGR02271 family)